MDSGSPLLGGLPAEDFLDRYWQKRPLLIRGAWPRLPVSIDAGELAGLALDETVESRVVMGDTVAEDWMLLHGPFDEAFFADTPNRDWTLLVQDLDKHLPAFGALLEPFRFIPDWRIDDLMASYAVPGGTVGPHRDRYDVFLLQGSGRREWRIQSPAPARETLSGHPDLRLLADFQATETWLLEPGDMLYLPPGVPHYGIATTECITYSIGFRAPSAGELVIAWAHECAAQLDDDLRYTDRDLRVQGNAAEIPPAALQRLRQLLRTHIAADDLALDRWLGRHLSSPKTAFRALEREEPVDVPTLARRLRDDAVLVPNPAVRFHLIRYDDRHVLLFAHGEEHHLDHAATKIAWRLAGDRRLVHSDLATANGDRAEQLHRLTDWLNSGWILFVDELED